MKKVRLKQTLFYSGLFLTFLTYFLQFSRNLHSHTQHPIVAHVTSYLDHGYTWKNVLVFEGHHLLEFIKFSINSFFLKIGFIDFYLCTLILHSLFLTLLFLTLDLIFRAFFSKFWKRILAVIIFVFYSPHIFWLLVAAENNVSVYSGILFMIYVSLYSHWSKFRLLISGTWLSIGFGLQGISFSSIGLAPIALLGIASKSYKRYSKRYLLILTIAALVHLLIFILFELTGTENLLKRVVLHIIRLITTNSVNTDFNERNLFAAQHWLDVRDGFTYFHYHVDSHRELFISTLKSATTILVGVYNIVFAVINIRKADASYVRQRILLLFTLLFLVLVLLYEPYVGERWDLFFFFNLLTLFSIYKNSKNEIFTYISNTLFVLLILGSVFGIYTSMKYSIHSHNDPQETIYLKEFQTKIDAVEDLYQFERIVVANKYCFSNWYVRLRHPKFNHNSHVLWEKAGVRTISSWGNIAETCYPGSPPEAMPNNIQDQAKIDEILSDPKTLLID